MSNASSATQQAGKTLIIHIGDHKTGTTSIQDAFATKRVTLPGRSILYPGLLDHNYLGEQAKLLAAGKPLPNSRPGMPNLERIAEQMAKNRVDTCLLSAEAFEGIPPQALRNVIDQLFLPRFPDLKLRVIGYIRPHAGRILSTYSEQTKIGWFQGDPAGMFQRTLKSRRFFYAPRLRNWQAIFGDQLTLRPMVRSALRNGSVVDDFVATAFDDQPFEIAPAPSSNESLNLQDLMLIKYVHSHLASVHPGARLELGWDIAQRIGSKAPSATSTKLALHRPLARRIQDAYLEDAKAIDTEFFSNQSLFEADLEKSVNAARPTAQSCAPEDYFSPEELRNIALLAETLAGMLGREQMDWIYWFRQRRAEAVAATVDATQPIKI